MASEGAQVSAVGTFTLKGLWRICLCLLPPANKVLHVSVILSTGGGLSATHPLGRHPPRQTTPPGQTPAPPGQNPPPRQTSLRQCMLGYTPLPADTVNKRAVRIPLECILVQWFACNPTRISLMKPANRLFLKNIRNEDLKNAGYLN